MVARDDGDDVPLPESPPLTTRHRCATPLPKEEGTRGAYVAYPWLITSHVPGYGVRAFPAAHRSGRRVLVPVAPRLTQSPPKRETTAERRRLGPITRSSPYRQPHPTFQVGRQGERAI